MSIEEALQLVIDEKVKKITQVNLEVLSSKNYHLTKKLEKLESKLEEILTTLSDRNNDFSPGEISGDKISGGTITKFSSTGISDEASNKRLTVLDDRVVIEKNLEVKGTVQIKELLYYKAKCDDLDVKNSVRIDGHEVLWKDRLGNIVTKSRLTELGVLNELNVADTLTVYKNKVGINVKDPVGVFGVTENDIQVGMGVKGDIGFVGTVNSDTFSIGTSYEPTLYVSHDNKVGIKIKKPKADLDVAGYIRYQGQTHQYNNEIPSSGNWSTGDICWNSEPDSGKPLGWVCVKSGSPGTWKKIDIISQ